VNSPWVNQKKNDWNDADEMKQEVEYPAMSSSDVPHAVVVMACLTRHDEAGVWNIFVDRSRSVRSVQANHSDG